MMRTLDSFHCIFILIPAPDAGPQIASVIKLGPQSLNISWSHLSKEHWWGVPGGYHVDLVPQIDGGERIRKTAT